ncbi:hypothetical protein PS624_05976 [Pseudomonas fluorescens]|uniref:Uncharacterized protein n=1 Tax=Pseudomonas fluorescens TaxID=294 RepID=A0A5E6Y5R7_PSEFL|nr:hypothetical protein PS624_05976 [Pseudomonas fluorescens]
MTDSTQDRRIFRHIADRTRIRVILHTAARQRGFPDQVDLIAAFTSRIPRDFVGCPWRLRVQKTARRLDYSGRRQLTDFPLHIDAGDHRRGLVLACSRAYIPDRGRTLGKGSDRGIGNHELIGKLGKIDELLRGDNDDRFTLRRHTAPGHFDPVVHVEVFFTCINTDDDVLVTQLLEINDGCDGSVVDQNSRLGKPRSLRIHQDPSDFRPRRALIRIVANAVDHLKSHRYIRAIASALDHAFSEGDQDRMIYRVVDLLLSHRIVRYFLTTPAAQDVIESSHVFVGENMHLNAFLGYFRSDPVRQVRYQRVRETGMTFFGVVIKAAGALEFGQQNQRWLGVLERLSNSLYAIKRLDLALQNKTFSNPEHQSLIEIFGVEFLAPHRDRQIAQKHFELVPNAHHQPRVNDDLQIPLDRANGNTAVVMLRRSQLGSAGDMRWAQGQWLVFNQGCVHGDAPS